MTELVARLDRQLSRKGETVTVKRRIGTGQTTFVTLTARARISGYQGQEVTLGIELTDSKFILSPTPFGVSSSWPGAAGGPAYPRRGDWIVSRGVDRHIEQALPIVVGGIVVRIEGRVR